MVRLVQPIPISSRGQISIPAAIRRRWGTRCVRLIDHGDELVVRPVPDDPIGAAAGALAAYRAPGTDEIRVLLSRDEQDIELLRRDEQDIEDERFGRQA